MQELGTMLRALELHKIIEDKVSELRERATRVRGVTAADSYQQSGFVRHTNKRKNSSEINRIIAKYSKPIKRTDEKYIFTPITHRPPIRPNRQRKNNLKLSKSEDNLANIGIMNNPDPEIRPPPRSKYRTKSYEDITAFVDIDRVKKSKHFQENSILNAKPVIKERPKLHSINEDIMDQNKLETCNIDLRLQANIVGNRESKRNTVSECDSISSDSDKFPKCSVSQMRKGTSEPDILSVSVSSGDSVGDNKTLDSRKRWKILRQPLVRKGTFDCLLRWRWKRSQNTDPDENESRIQDVDNSFFEKFGSRLQQTSIKAALEESTPLAPLSEIDDRDGDQKCDRLQDCGSMGRDSDSGNETMPDTEPDDPGKIELFEEAVGWNIDELYRQVLYVILHNVGGCDVNWEVDQFSMLSHVQEAFKIANDKHTALLAEAESKEPPELMLNVEVMEAKELVPMDPNGLSDPFVTMYLSSSTSLRYNTSVKSSTLNPVWEEHFSLPMSGNIHKDSLCLEVWDFDPAETIKEKMNKIFEVKGVKGLRKLMKEIAVTASTGKHNNELIGRANIPLKSIPAGGLTMWYSLDKKNKLRRQGVVKVRLNFSSEKNSQVAAQEHRHLLRILLLHELENSKVAPYWWSGNFSAAAESVLTQFTAQSGLSQNEIYLDQWSVYCAVTTDHPLSFTLFNSLLDKMIKPLKSGIINDTDEKLFFDGAKKLLPTCFTHIRKLRKKTAGDKSVMKTLKEVLSVLYKLSAMNLPHNLDLFPPNLYGWLRNDGRKVTIYEALNQAATQGASDWFIHILDNNECKNKSEETRLQHLIRVIQLVRSDLQRAIEYYDRAFIEIMSYPYSKALYGLYENKIASLVEPEVTEVCKSLKRLRYEEISSSSVQLAGGLNDETGSANHQVVSEPLAMGTTLFELYLALQRFLTLGQSLNETEWQHYSISKFHNWFYGGVAQWLDIAAYKALTRIEKAVVLDELMPVDTNVKYSSSGVDTVSIFYQIKIFWEQLSWPDIEGTYTFAGKIVDDICRCCVFYSDRMSERVESIGSGAVSSVLESRFEITTEWCVAINNIDYVRQSLSPFVEQLGMEQIIHNMCETRTPMEAQRCKETLQNVVENAIDTAKNKIIELSVIMVRKMMPSISKFLIEGAELYHQDCSSMDRVMRYLEANLDILYQYLNNENFSRTLEIVWEQLVDVIYELIETNLELRKPKISRYIDPRRHTKSAAANLDVKKRPPSFFSNLHECLKIMIRSFQQENKGPYSSEKLDSVEYLLKLHGMETKELIHQFYLKRWQGQQNITEPTLGQLTIRAQFIQDDMKLEIMNARNLVPTDSSSLCNSYVRVAFLPEDNFANVVKPKTQTHNKNLFPLYDEIFDIHLTHEQRTTKDALLQFAVKDKDMFGNTFMGEAYLRLSDIPETDAPIESLPQVHLPLTRPAQVDGDSFKVLETRQSDKQTRDFLKKQKQKMPMPSK